jgi:ribonuclease-3
MNKMKKSFTNKRKFFNRDKYNYWNGYVIQSTDVSLNNDIINEIEHNSSYDILEIGNSGKIKRTKNISVKNRELYTRYKLNSELPYLKKYKHLVSVNPPGKKYLCYIKNFSNKNQCIFINRYKDKNLNYEHQVLKIDIELDNDLFKGTLFEGQAVKKKDGKWYYVIDDIYLYKGNNIMNNSFTERLKLLKTIFECNYFKKIQNDYIDIYENISNNVILFEIKLYVEYKYALDLINNHYRFLNYFDNNDKFKNKNNNKDGYNGDIPKGIIFTNIDINATKIHYILPIDEYNTNETSIVESDNLTNNIPNKFTFKIKKTDITDIYELYCKSNEHLILYSNACIPFLKQSQIINSYFKKQSIDFNNIDSNYANQEVKVLCEYNTSFNKWSPIRLSDDEISDEITIKQHENMNSSKEEIINTKIYNVPKYDKNNYLIYNEHNITLDINFINNMLVKYDINHKINNFDIIQNAFIHKTYSKNYYIKEYNKEKSGKNQIYCKVAYHLITNNIKDCNKTCLDLFESSNERLEWFGDAKLADIISTYLEQRYPNEDEGFLTLLRSKLVMKNTLYEIGKNLGLHKYIIMSKNFEYYENGRDNVDAIEDCFEALIGALYKEFEQNKCEYKLRLFVINLYEKELDITNIIKMDNNYKAKIMEYYHKLYKKNPIYKEEHDETNENNLFKVNIIEPLNHEIIGSGIGKTKKKAEQNAAQNALIYLQLI